MRPLEARATGTRHMAAAGNRVAALAAFQVLEAGGNAIDAGVAGGIALNVVCCEFTHFAGVAPIMVWSAADGRAHVIDGLGVWPRRADPEHFRRHHGGAIPPGVLRSVVPGAPSAWITALERFGTMSFGEVAAPAIRLAREGFVVSHMFHRVVGDLAAEFARWPQNAALFLPDGKPPPVGALFRLTELAGTLDHMVAEERRAARAGGRGAGLAAAHDAFYRGDIARAIDAYYRQQDGWLDAEDLAAFRARVEAPLTVRFHDVDLLTCGPWCQGPVLGQALGILAEVDLKALGHNTQDYIHIVIEALKLAFADREAWYGDPEFVDVPIAGLLDSGYARERAALIGPDAHPGMPPAGAPAGAAPRAPALPHAADAAASLDTSFVCVADRHGNLFSATPSDGCFAGPIVPGTGICPSSRGAQSWTDPAHASVLAPGKRPRLTPSPAIAIRAGRFMPFGTPGDDLQPQAMLQFLLNHVVFGMELQEAAEAPRFATVSFPRSFEPHGYFPARMVIESRIDADTRAALGLRGHEVITWDDWDWKSGCVCAVARDRDGMLEGAADPRRPAGAVGW